jgi:DNA repair protein RadD
LGYFLVIPREYQRTALDAIWLALQHEKCVLLEAACSAGKTLMFSKVIQRLLAENPTFRALILLDRNILVTQSRDKLVAVAPELQLDIGIVCASVTNDKDHSKRITIASRQSLINQLDTFEPVQLCIVDEAHLMAMPKEGVEPDDQYGKILQRLWKYNRKMRTLGVTATPYRLSDGYIYGRRNKGKLRPYFKELHHKITTGELENLGFLAPLKGVTAIPDDFTLENVGLVAGEYNLGRLSDLMERQVHIQSAVKAWKEHASERRKTLAFCVTIRHAETLAQAFNDAGIPALAIHSDLDPMENYTRMQALENGTAKVFCSVAKLTTGMDVPDIDCILMCRATKSTALYKQKIGRGQRIAPGKTDCLVIDMVGNNEEHGTNLDKLKVRWSSGQGEVQSNSTVKECPQCEAELHIAVRICPDCEFEFPRPKETEAGDPNMEGVEYGSSPPVELKVTGMFMSEHISKKNERSLLKIRLEMEKEYGFGTMTGNVWICFPDDGYAGFAIEKGRMLWDSLSEGRVDYPESTKKALEHEDEIVAPDYAIVDLSGRWPEVKEIGHREEVMDELPDTVPF